MYHHASHETKLTIPPLIQSSKLRMGAWNPNTSRFVSVFVQPKNHHLTFGCPNIPRAPFHQPRDGATRRPSRPILCSLQKSSQTSSPMLVPAAGTLGKKSMFHMEPYLENHPTLRIHLPLLWKQQALLLTPGYFRASKQVDLTPHDIATSSPPPI